MANLEKYRSARLVKGSQGWYIIYYQTNPFTGEFKPHKETHNINRIKSKKQRLKKANELLKKINSQLEYGYPFSNEDESVTLTLKLTPIIEAIDLALKLKLAEFNRESSRKGPRGKANFFKKYLRDNNLDSLKIGEWNRLHNNKFITHLSLDNNFSGTTYNDYLRQLKGLFDILLEKHYITTNYFDSQKKRKEVPVKIRKRFKDDIRSAFINEVKKADDKWFLLAIVLQYYFFFRPIEISRLKISAIDLDNFEIELPETMHKTYKTRYMKMPSVAIKYFPQEIKSINQNWYVIGSGIKPNTIKVDKNGMYRRNLRYLKKLEEKGFDITGLTFYSWKNTGGFDMLNKNAKITLLDVQDRMGHSDIKTTKRYVTANDKNAEHIKNEL